MRDILGHHGLRPRHALGQHFLVDDAVYDRILAEAAPSPDDWIVEIGSGLGTLTRRLAALVPSGRLVALERDPALHALLAASSGRSGEAAAAEGGGSGGTGGADGSGPVECWLGDAVRFDFRALARRAQKKLIVVGNIPYCISGPLLAALADRHDVVVRAVLMLQREVAERIVAGPGSKAYGTLSVLLRLHFDVRLVRTVGRMAFVPPPRVESALVRLDALGAPRVAVGSEDLFRRVVKAAFGRRRKTLRNALGASWAREEVGRALELSGIDGSRRGETLSLAEFARLARALAAVGGAGADGAANDAGVDGAANDAGAEGAANDAGADGAAGGAAEGHRTAAARRFTRQRGPKP